MRRVMTAIALLLAGALGACGDLGYYAQCATGHLGILSRCRPIPAILADPETPVALRERLQAVTAIRDFASAALALPDNGSYRSYGDLGRSSAVWNVVAAPEFSLAPRQWCFPVAGCVSYRGYFRVEAAEAFAASLRGEGLDVDLYGVPAYSTLNWFDDPVLNTFLDRPDPQLAGMIFHELSHQVLYVPGDTPFNEAFASTVEAEGVRRWLQERGGEEGGHEEGMRRQEAVLDLLASLREELALLYAGPLPPEAMRREKELLLEGARARYGALRESWGGYPGYDRLFEELNNARLASVSAYHRLVPAFRRLLAAQGGDLAAFYRAAREIAALPEAERHARLQGTERLARAD